MRVSDDALAEVRSRGFVVVPGFLTAAEVAAAQEALWLHYPRPEDYFADPAAYGWLAASQFAGLQLFPFRAWALSGLALHPSLVDAAERFLGTSEIELYKGELWAKYSGATDYDQAHHRDYGNHSLVVPRRDGWATQMTTFLLLSDVTEHDGPTCLIPREIGDAYPFTPRQLAKGELVDAEIPALGPAGTLMIYTTDILHRASTFDGPGRSRFALLADFAARGRPWMGKMSWPGRALDPNMHEVLVRSSVRQRDLLGFPPPGSDYWNEQTLTDVAARWPSIDLTPYRAGAANGARPHVTTSRLEGAGEAAVVGEHGVEAR